MNPYNLLERHWSELTLSAAFLLLAGVILAPLWW